MLIEQVQSKKIINCVNGIPQFVFGEHPPVTIDSYVLRKYSLFPQSYTVLALKMMKAHSLFFLPSMWL